MAAAATLMEEDDVPMPWEFDVCQYHKHDFTAKCERKVDTPVVASNSTPVCRGQRHACPDAEQHGCSKTYVNKQDATRHNRTAHHGEPPRVQRRNRASRVE